MNDKIINTVAALVQNLPADDRAVKAPEDGDETFDRHLREEVGAADLPRPAREQPTPVREAEPRATVSRPKDAVPDSEQAATEPAPQESPTDGITQDGAAVSAVAAVQPSHATANLLPPTAKQTVDSDPVAGTAPTDDLPLPQDLTALLESDLAVIETDPEAMVLPVQAGAAMLGPRTELGIKAMRDLEALSGGGSKGPLAALALAKSVGAGGTQSANGMPPGLDVAAGRLEMNGAGQQSMNGADPLAILNQLAERAIVAKAPSQSVPAAMTVAVESRPEATLSQMPPGLGAVGEIAAGRAADAAGVRLAHAAHGTQPAVRQVAVHIARAVESGSDRIRIQLNPAELGRVDVRLEVANDGRVTAVVAAEKAETLDLLRRDAHGLEKALAEAGLKADGGSLQFSLQGEQADQESQTAGGSGNDAADDADGDLDAATLAAIDAGRWRAVDGVVDITV
jgi:hypothetical protein